MKQLVIDRSTWCRGNPMAAALLNDEGGRCCLGFYLAACGVPDERLARKGDPEVMLHDGGELPPEASWLLRGGVSKANSTACNELIRLNDCSWQDERERERAIAKKFAERKIEVVFVDASDSGSEGAP